MTTKKTTKKLKVLNRSQLTKIVGGAKGLRMAQTTKDDCCYAGHCTNTSSAPPVK